MKLMKSGHIDDPYRAGVSLTRLVHMIRNGFRYHEVRFEVVRRVRNHIHDLVRGRG